MIFLTGIEEAQCRIRPLQKQILHIRGHFALLLQYDSQYMRKVTAMSDPEIQEIAEAYADYVFKPGEKSIFSVFGTRDRILRYLEMSIRTALRSGWIYSVGEDNEAYIAISYSDSHPPLHIMLSFPFRAMKAVGTRSLYDLSQLLRNGGPSLADRMKRSGERFLSVEMLCVRKEYQGKGYMRMAMEDIFRLADEKRLPVILETDETLKADKYRHLGMELESVRHFTPEIAFYEMIYRPESML